MRLEVDFKRRAEAAVKRAKERARNELGWRIWEAVSCAGPGVMVVLTPDEARLLDGIVSGEGELALWDGTRARFRVES